MLRKGWEACVWSADAVGLQRWSWGEVDSCDTTTGCLLSQLSSQMNNPLWHRQGEDHSPASRAQGSSGWQKKASMLNPPRGLESTPGEPCRATSWRVLPSAGLKTKLEMGQHVQLSPRDWHLNICIWGQKECPREPVSQLQMLSLEVHRCSVSR